MGVIPAPSHLVRFSTESASAPPGIRRLPGISHAGAAGVDLARFATIAAVDSLGPPIVVLGGLSLLAVLLLAIRRAWAARAPATGFNVDSSDRSGDRSTDTATSSGGATGEDRRPPSRPIRTDDERVVQLLIANRGRMKQSHIVEETDWSKAKVSRLLSRMEERDLIVRTRAGRENIVQLADANLSIST